MSRLGLGAGLVRIQRLETSGIVCTGEEVGKPDACVQILDGVVVLKEAMQTIW